MSQIGSRPRLAVLALMSARHKPLRCFMRASILSLCTVDGDHDRGQWMAVKGGGSILLRFIAPPGNVALQQEDSLHHDLLVLDETEHSEPSTCAARVLIGLRRLLSAPDVGDRYAYRRSNSVPWQSLC